MSKEHFLEQHDPERKDFQIDRIILFSDAVFAIAITLLVIEIKAPEILKGFTPDQILEQLYELVPKFWGFFLSFLVIALNWRSHHRTFGFVNHYTNRLILLNFFFLFTLVLMPFSSAYYSENTRYNVPYYFYNINIILTGITNYALIKYVFNPKNGIVEHQPTIIFKKLFMARTIAIPIIFLFGILIWPLSRMYAQMSPILIWPVFALLRLFYKRKYLREVKQEEVVVEEGEESGNPS
ncbi:TMEM175 family protein [Mucilaginibacter jinjuensis]|uniref:TMEM175 family protein n=1 Tax=Mucilaginibacter jinjuensis TaxID=1176721 RepID=A0ABY7TAB1_9SPHI|nr:TMEM175 family protein [Mucilaginibacter jinjuensis]WCT13045.1 TMEM175 family protein [Mucilaginibacter jinjuensis]